jgi:hypothetical protein
MVDPGDEPAEVVDDGDIVLEVVRPRIVQGYRRWPADRRSRASG